MNKLPTWCEMSLPERHKILGELVDAMIYSGEAVLELELKIEEFKSKNYIRSVIMPEDITTD
jgi:hypothetical protein